MPSGTLESIYTVNLGVKAGERVMVFTDLVGEDEDITDDERARRVALVGIARDVADAGEKFCRVELMKYKAVGSHGKEPPRELWEACFGRKTVAMLDESGLLNPVLSKKADAKGLKAAEQIIEKHAACPSAIIALSNYSTSHTRFRDFLTRVKKVRYASMPLFERSMCEGAMTADWAEVERRTKRLVSMMSGADTVVVTSGNGTSISFSMKDREVLPDTGILTKPGSFGNLPAGEAFLAPVEGTADGLLILEWAPTGKFHKPVELIVKKGQVVEVVGDDEFSRDLRDRIAKNPLCGNIAELGIGTNDRATRPDNILETEKILGTVHIALGDNSSFGGKVSVPFHQDFIFFRPNMEVIKGEEKIEILVEGEPRFEVERR
ncbi:hypothetical protein ANRL3_02517 [Anaerolineae bacterium]|nr:hypothetical protein ANRL3_02517 [Anaerolineae bacterium]